MLDEQPYFFASWAYACFHLEYVPTTALLHLYSCLLKNVLRRPNNEVSGLLSYLHIAKLYRYHSNSIFLFMTFLFVQTTIKESFKPCPNIVFDHYVWVKELYLWFWLMAVCESRLWI